MKISTTLTLLAAFFFMGCETEFFEENKDAFYKLYGNGTIQEGVAMRLHEDGTIFMVGNQYVRNQDSAAVCLFRTDDRGNQLWSKKYFGKGYTTARAILAMPTEEQLVLAASRMPDGSNSAPLLLRVSKEGVLAREYSLDQVPGTTPQNRIPEDMVLGDGGTVFILGNIHEGGVPVRSFIQKLDLETGNLLDQREYITSEITEGKKILRIGDKFLVIGNTRYESGDARNQSIFLVTYSANLIEAGQVVIGSPNNDTFKKAFVSASNELVILSAEQKPNLAASRGGVWFVNLRSLAVQKMAYLDYSTDEVPEAIIEDENGDLYIAVNAIGERGNTNILLNKTDYTVTSLWSAAKTIGGAGNDRVEEVKIDRGYVYLLSTLDMQNENTLISLSKIRF